MTQADVRPADGVVLNGMHPVASLPPRRRLPGLKLRAVPSGPLLAQVVGGGATLAGVYLTWGVAIALVVGGVVAVALGALREAGRV